MDYSHMIINSRLKIGLSIVESNSNANFLPCLYSGIFLQFASKLRYYHFSQLINRLSYN